MHRIRRIARERIELLMKKAESTFPKDRELSRRYVELARKVAMKCPMRFPKKWNKRICRKCNSLLVPGENCRVRIYKHRIIITCLECGNVRRIPLRRKGNDDSI